MECCAKIARSARKRHAKLGVFVNHILVLNIQIYIIIDKILVYFNLVGIYDTLMKILGDVLR